MMQELAKTGHSPTRQALDQIDYIETPISIEEYLNNPYYMGWLKDQIYPAWYDEFYKVYGPGSQIQEWLLTGAIGTGKTFNAVLGQTYDLYRVSCMRHPQKFLGLAEGTPIVFGLFSVFAYKAKDQPWQYFHKMLEKSPYFREKFPLDKNFKNDIFLPRDVRVVTGATALQAIGENMFTVFIDESDFMRVDDEKKSRAATGQAAELYAATRRRMESRFMKFGRAPGVMGIGTSKTHETSFSSGRIQAFRDGDPTIHVSDFAIWEVGKPSLEYSGKKFFVIPGSRYKSTQLVEPGGPEPTDYHIEVPVEHYNAFVQDREGALRDIAGIATTEVSPWIHQPERITAAIDTERKHPFFVDEIVYSIESTDSLLSYLDVEALTRISDGSRVPRLNPRFPRYFHVDIGLTKDCLGIALGHVSKMGWTKTQRADMTSFDVPAPVVTVDFAIRIRPPKGSEIDLDRVVQFIFALRNLGYNIKKGSYDGFQSRHSVQLFTKLGWDVDFLSVDKKPCLPYSYLREAYMSGRISHYDYPPLTEELVRLRQFSDGKVDHPKKGSKDIADALAGMYFHCLTDAGSMLEEMNPDDVVAMPPMARYDADGRPPGDIDWLLRDDQKDLDFSDVENLP